MLKTPKDLGLTNMTLMGASFFEQRCPLLAGKVGGKVVVCQLIETKLVPLRMRLHAWQLRDVGRVGSFPAMTGSPRAKGQAMSLRKFFARVNLAREPRAPHRPTGADDSAPERDRP